MKTFCFVAACAVSLLWMLVARSETDTPSPATTTTVPSSSTVACNIETDDCHDDKATSPEQRLLPDSILCTRKDGSVFTTERFTSVCAEYEPGIPDEGKAPKTRSGCTVCIPTYSFVTVGPTVNISEKERIYWACVSILDNNPSIDRLFKSLGISRETLLWMISPRIIIEEEEEDKMGSQPSP